MNTAEYVDKLIADRKAEGVAKDLIAWEAANACVSWGYVFAQKGQYCDPENRRKRVSDEHPTVKRDCQVLNGSKGSCNGCKWFPDGKRTRNFDCRGFTYWILKAVYGWVLYGETTVTQWGKADNWKIKGTIDQMPKDTLCCLFQYDSGKKKMVHTGFGYNNQTVECQKGVQYFATRNKKWSHYAVPKCVEGDIPVPEPTDKPTLRRGDSGPYVTLMQTDLVKRGYDIGKTGADGKFGKQTEAALKAFQRDAGLVADGVCGPLTWAALDDAPTTLYTVTIPHLTSSQADALVNQYAGAYKTAEE